jgi:hypothetical protein
MRLASLFANKTGALPSGGKHWLLLLALLAAAGAAAWWWWWQPRANRPESIARVLRLRARFADRGAHAAWEVRAGQRCANAALLMPTSGLIGFGWNDSFRSGHRHTGYDIYSPLGVENMEPVVAASAGYLTREPDWLSTVIIRHLNFGGVHPPAQVWTYYTHMAAADGKQSFVDAEFPPGTREVFVEAGTVLGKQGTWSGTQHMPTGLHLHFSVVRSEGDGGYANETRIDNTYDPGPLLGVTADASGVLRCAN